MIARLLQARRDEESDPSHDLTTRLLFEELDGRRLNDAEIVSILRNWTAGGIDTISTTVGILVHFFDEHPDLQGALRRDPTHPSYAIDEILRIRGPLLTNRRITTRAITMGDHEIGARERVMIAWVPANRDGQVFADPLSFRWDRDPDKNLLYGAGLHVCLRAPLARLELRVLTEELQNSDTPLTLATEEHRLAGRATSSLQHTLGQFVQPGFCKQELYTAGFDFPFLVQGTRMIRAKPTRTQNAPLQLIVVAQHQQDFGHADGRWRAGQAHPPARTSDRFKHAAHGQSVHDFYEEVKGDTQFVCD